MTTAPPAGRPPGAGPAAPPPPVTGASPPPPAPATPLAQPPATTPAATPISRLLTEADVYLKYGLHQKALDHVQKILAEDAENPDALERIRDIRDAMGDRRGAAEAAERAVQSLLARGGEGRIEHAIGRLRELDPSHAAAAAVEEEEAEVVPPKAAESELEPAEVLVLPHEQGPKPVDEEEPPVLVLDDEAPPPDDAPAPEAEVGPPEPEGSAAVAEAAPEVDEAEDVDLSDVDERRSSRRSSFPRSLLLRHPFPSGPLPGSRPSWKRSSSTRGKA